MGWLKALVIGMGVLIVLGLAGVVYGIARNAEKLQQREAAGDAGPAEPLAGFGARTLDTPPGCRLAASHPLGARLLVLRLDGLPERGCQQVLVVDLGDGSVISRLSLRSE